MKRLLNPLLLLMASAPEADKKLELLMYALQATNESVKNIKNGIDNFQSTVIKMASNEFGPAQNQNSSADSGQPSQKPDQEENAAPFEETETPPEPDPEIMMPSAADFPEQ